MLCTAMGAAITSWLDDPAIVEIMLNPDGRLWIDRLAGGLSDTGKRLSAEDGERIVRVVAHHVGSRSAVWARTATSTSTVRRCCSRRPRTRRLYREDFHEIFTFALLSGNASAHRHILESENEGHAIVSNPRHMSTFCEIGDDAPLHLAAPAAHKRA
jgi:hypothetical protein